ncbi:MAG: hypothetical protein O7H41_13510 [Planctomycetota bacterium]|nr:hypothetical protein [Planctomycetota bacterium]
MYRLLLILLSQAVIIVSCGHDSRETTSPSEASLPTAESADGEWRAHEVVHDFTLQLPADVSKSPGRGVDSHYERFVSDLFEIYIDYGRYGFRASWESDSDLVREDTVIDSRKATVSSCSKGMKVHLPFDSCTADWDPGRRAQLTVVVSYRSTPSAEMVRIAERILRSIDFKE